ncbi:MAG: hypothetical protein NTW19_24070 [Planctomycetota bacterium]|nr:hypothetical protein [Planctomycetota bacterium]
MNINTLDNLNRTLPLGQLGAITRPAGGETALGAWNRQGTNGQHFSELLNPRDTAADRESQSRDQSATTAARQLVSTTLILPMMKQMRQDPFKVAMFHGGNAEDAFNSQLDTLLADRLTSRANLPIVASVEKWITRTRETPAAAKAAAPKAEYVKPESVAGQRINLHG